LYCLCEEPVDKTVLPLTFVVSEYTCYTHAPANVCVCVVMYWTWWSRRVSERDGSSCVWLRLFEPTTQGRRQQVSWQADVTPGHHSATYCSSLTHTS